MNMLIEKNVMVRMRDGVHLATDIYRPTEQDPFPVLLMRSPYGKEDIAIYARAFVQAGYAVVIQDSRGCFASQGEFTPMFVEPADGADTIARAAHQPWSSGKVGMIGASYLGFTQWLAAREAPEALKAISPAVTASNFYHAPWYQGGAFQLGVCLAYSVQHAAMAMQRKIRLGQATTADMEPITQAVSNIPSLYEHLPFVDMPLLRETSPFYFDCAFPEHDFSPRATLDFGSVQIRWFDHWLKGIDNGVEQDKPVRIFVMGEDRWREEDDWPLPDTRYLPYYLRSGGHANSAAGDGLLSTEPPGDEAEDVYLYDPRNPVPTIGGPTLMADLTNTGPRDQRVVESRDDVLCYTTPSLEEPVEVTGPIELVVYISSSARDTDFTGKLVDVYPDGRSEILSDGILRSRYRNSFSLPVLMEPGNIYELHIDLMATSNVFKEGHRIRLDISSSNFPRFDRNTNTGGTIATESEKDFVQAVNRIYHDSMYPSHLVLPIIERD